jgi:hypothetical protein
MPITKEQADAFRAFLDAKHIGRQCRACGDVGSITVRDTVLVIPTADQPTDGVRLLTISCFNCGATFFFNPKPAGLSV